jgi:glycosyltransferase involved in cell wall biosynthesis
MKPRISIITPCYNSEQTISQTIESVLSQRYPNLEYIIIDGSSTDRTLSIIQHYFKLANGCLKYISEPDTGIYNAMNKGLHIASGDIIGIINSDDWYEPNALNELSQVYDYNIPSVYYGILRKISKDQEYNLERNSHEFIKNKMIPHPACFVSRVLYDNYGLFNEHYRFSSDYELMLRFIDHDVNFIKINKIIANFRLGGSSSTELASLETLKLKMTKNYISRNNFLINSFKLKLKISAKKILNK